MLCLYLKGYPDEKVGMVVEGSESSWKIRWRLQLKTWCFPLKTVFAKLERTLTVSFGLGKENGVVRSETALEGSKKMRGTLVRVLLCLYQCIPLSWCNSFYKQICVPLNPLDLVVLLPLHVKDAGFTLKNYFHGHLQNCSCLCSSVTTSLFFYFVS